MWSSIDSQWLLSYHYLFSSRYVPEDERLLEEENHEDPKDLTYVSKQLTYGTRLFSVTDWWILCNNCNLDCEEHPIKSLAGIVLATQTTQLSGTKKSARAGEHLPKLEKMRPNMFM